MRRHPHSGGNRQVMAGWMPCTAPKRNRSLFVLFSWLQEVVGHMTLQQPQPCLAPSSSSRLGETACAMLPGSGTVAIGCRGLGSGLIFGLSWIFGIVEYEPNRPCCIVGLRVCGFSGHSSCFSDSAVDPVASLVGFSSASGGLARPSSLSGRNSLSYTLPNFPSRSHFSCWSRLATVGSNCWSGGSLGSGRYAEIIHGGSPSGCLLAAPADTSRDSSRSPDRVEGRVAPVPLLFESLLVPFRVFGRPADKFIFVGADVFRPPDVAVFATDPTAPGVFLGDTSDTDRVAFCGGEASRGEVGTAPDPRPPSLGLLLALADRVLG